MGAWRDRSEQIIIGLATNWAAPLVIAAIFVAWNWMSSGAVVRALGGMTKAEVAEYLKENAPPASASTGDWKLELVVGAWSDVAYKDSEGTYTATTTQEQCPEGTTLISVYCARNEDATKAKVFGALEDIGLSKGRMDCTWDGISKFNDFQGSAQAICARIVKK